jgi:DNA recombination protein RmuC
MTTYIIAGIVIGLIIGWLVAINRASAKIRTAEAKAISFETTANELRSQIKQISEEKSKLELELNQLIQAKVKAETDLKNATERIAEEKKLLEEATQKLTDVFKAIASDTLSVSTKNLLELAKENFAKILTDAKGDFGKNQEAISGLIKPLTQNLHQFDEYLKAIEKSREGAYSELKTHLESLYKTQESLKKETSSLVTALRTPHIRGKWGELTLRRVVELAGMVEHCDFEEQIVSEDASGENKQRPDMLIHLPDDRLIIVDAKVSLAAYLNAIESQDEEQRKQVFIKHAQQIKEHVKTLAEKDYSKKFARSPEFTVMFIPGESFFSAALEYDRDLFEYALEKHVVIATPVTLVALLRAISFSWRQANVMKSAEQLILNARELYERVGKVFEHLSKLGDGLNKAVLSYNSTVSSIEARMLPTLQRFQEFGVVSKEEEIKSPQQIETTTHSFDKQL